MVVFSSPQSDLYHLWFMHSLQSSKNVMWEEIVVQSVIINTKQSAIINSGKSKLFKSLLQIQIKLHSLPGSGIYCFSDNAFWMVFCLYQMGRY